MPKSPYTSQHARQLAQLEREVVRLRAAAAPFNPGVARTAETFVRKYDVPNTAIRYCQSVTRYLRWCEERQIDPCTVYEDHAGMFKASLTGLAAGSRRNYIVAIKGFYRSLAKNRVIADNPYADVSTKEVKPETPTPALTKEQLTAVLLPLRRKITAGTASLVETRDFTLLFVVSRIGARRASLMTVTWSGWGYDGRAAALNFVQKGGGGVTVRMSADLIAVIEDWRIRLERAIGRPVRPDEPIFPWIGHTGKIPHEPTLIPLTGRGLLDAVKRHLLAAGIEGYRKGFHMFRATSATLAFLDGATVEEIKQTGGWATNKTVERYLRCEMPNALSRWSLDLDDEGAA